MRSSPDGSRRRCSIHPAIEGALPSQETMRADLFGLLRRDRANIEAGHYRRPSDLVANPLPALARSLRFLADLGAIDQRRRERIGSDLDAAEAPGRTYPAYYLRNFHYQTDGYLSDRSAALYDFQVEVLFNGGAGAMRRQALVPIAQYLRGRRIRDQRLLDVACGTGSFLAMIKHNYPRLPVTGLDLSAPYLRHAGGQPRPLVVGEPDRGRRRGAAVCRRDFQPGDLRLSVP